MKAMVLAAGLGTRLRPLTDTRPKALVEIGGRTLLEINLERLRTFGVDDVIINVHHFADMMVEYLKAKDNFGMHLAVSREAELLDTGGGLKKAAWFFGDDAEPFVLHNVDVITSIDLRRMAEYHNEHAALATLAVQDRRTSRPLAFDQQLRLTGRGAGFAFSGIHVISPRLLPMLKEDGAFSIIDSYLRLASEGKKILGFRADEYEWRDVGKLDDLSAASDANSANRA
ncbi:MAG TPA: nucleotidyltransferase family protein [Terriglobia bacterium]|jgi:NDP-sugar pyrophosphorylase family protein